MPNVQIPETSTGETPFFANASCSIIDAQLQYREAASHLPEMRGTLGPAQ
jgi:hypothetical protein